MYLDLGPGACGLLVFRNDSNVEESRKDEDQSGSSGCSWKRGLDTTVNFIATRKILEALQLTYHKSSSVMFLALFSWWRCVKPIKLHLWCKLSYLKLRYLTCNTKNVSNVGNKYDQQVHNEQQAHCNGDVTQPVEGFLWEQQLQERSTNLTQIKLSGGFTGININHQSIQMEIIIGFNFHCSCVTTFFYSYLFILTGNKTTGTVRVTATRTASRTHRINVSSGSTLL